MFGCRAGLQTRRDAGSEEPAYNQMQVSGGVEVLFEERSHKQFAVISPVEAAKS